MMEKWFRMGHLVGFIDGSWKKNANGTTSSKIGGFLCKRLSSIEDIFSGPCPNYYGWEVELYALLFLMEAIKIKGILKKLASSLQTHPS